MAIDNSVKQFNEELHEGFEHPNPVPHTLATLKEWAGSNEKILDVGCGSGFYGGKFIEWGHKVTGLEISSSAAKAARALGLQVSEVDIQAPFPKELGTFRCISCIEVLEHLPAPQNTLRQIAKVIEPDGCLIVTLPNTAFWAHRLMLLVGRMVFVGEGKLPAWEEPHVRHFTLKSLTGLLKQCGFEVTEVRGTFTGFPGTLRPYLPLPFNLAAGFLQRYTKGLDFLCDKKPSYATAGLMVLAKPSKQPTSVDDNGNIPLPEFLRLRLEGDELYITPVNGEDKNIIFVETSLPFSDNQMNMVKIPQGVDCLLRPGKLLGEVHRVLKPGAKLTFQVDNPCHWQKRLDLLLGRFHSKADAADVTWNTARIRYFTEKQILHMLETHGFINTTVSAKPGEKRSFLPSFFAKRFHVTTTKADH